MRKEAEHARIDDQLCFALYSASLAVSGAYRAMLKQHGLTYPQYLAMLALWERDGCSVAELGSALRLESSTLSPMLKRLEALTLVSRRRSRDDERVTLLTVTPRGWLLEAAVTPVREEIESSTGLDAEAFAALRESLFVLRDRFA
ncbi:MULTISPECIES: MarR family transcriptional regulator [unclassified Leifsonia]|uniref:MarR family winged helix-turn-helix transcriptional regulator n=1 Tax=unclassified Leifsonia TaxID=2663824 RepID=UPI0008A7814D|nr:MULTISPECIES: MarR family transcriptional regulator [unclassified Leifsonia]SEI14584.1 DNA-binding transcriptional regulator, MarR family [Leifsonia sp. CL154]SFM02148.1 DNA-binding transcriptional regulator, MarR family [Leifsonia sp. CL147]